MSRRTESDDTTKPDEVWYKDGLAFTCTQCGKCCTGEPGVVWVSDEELDQIAAFTHEPADQVEAVNTKWVRGRRTLREKANGDCVYWDRKKGCTIYPVRPAQCQTWPFWASNLETPEDWQRTVDVCPGSGEGELIPVEEIVRRVKKIAM